VKKLSDKQLRALQGKEYPFVSSSPLPVREIADFYARQTNRPPVVAPDNCLCTGITCGKPHCARWWACFFNRYSAEDVVAMAEVMEEFG